MPFACRRGIRFLFGDSPACAGLGSRDWLPLVVASHYWRETYFQAQCVVRPACGVDSYNGVHPHPYIPPHGIIHLIALMKIALIVLGVVVVLCVAFEIACRIGSKRDKERFDKMTPEERFRYQNDMRKAELM